MNLAHIAARLVQTGNLSAEKKIIIDDIKIMLCDRFRNIDYTQAKQDDVHLLRM